MDKREKAMQWFKKQMLVHQSSEKARNAYKKIQQASLKEYTIEKYGLPGSRQNTTHMTNFSDDATRSYSAIQGSTPLQSSTASPRLASSISGPLTMRSSPSKSPLRLESLRPKPHTHIMTPQTNDYSSSTRKFGSTGAQSRRELAQLLSNQKAMRQRSMDLVARLNKEHTLLSSENETLKGVVQDLASSRDAKSAAMVDSVVDGAIMKRQASYMSSRNENLAEANRQIYKSAVRVEGEASALRTELSEAQMQLKVCQKLYETEQKNSLQSFTAVGRLKKELSEAKNEAMKIQMEHIEQIRQLESQLAHCMQQQQTSDSLVNELKNAAVKSKRKLKNVTSEMEQTKAQEKQTSLEIASQLGEVVETERLLQAQNRQVVEMLHDELKQQVTASKSYKDEVDHVESQLAEEKKMSGEFEAALQDRLRASMDLEEEFHEKLLQQKFYLEEVKQQKVSLRKSLMQNAADGLESEARQLRAEFDAIREKDAATASSQRAQLEAALTADHTAVIDGIRKDHEHALQRHIDEHVLERERFKLTVTNEMKSAKAAAIREAATKTQDEIDALKVYPRKLQLEHQEKLDVVQKEAAQRLRDMRARYDTELDAERVRFRQMRDDAQRAAEREIEKVNADCRLRVKQLQSIQDSSDQSYRTELAQQIRAEGDTVRDAARREMKVEKERLTREVVAQQNQTAALRAQVLSQKNEISSLTLHAAAKARTLESTWQAADGVFSEHRGILAALAESENGRLNELEHKAAAEMNNLRSQLATVETDIKAKYEQELVEKINAGRLSGIHERNVLVQEHEQQKRKIYEELHQARLESVKAAAESRSHAQEEANVAMAQAHRLIAAQRERDAVVKRALENQVSALRDRQRQLAAQVERLLQIT